MVVELKIEQRDVDVLLGAVIVDGRRIEFATNFTVSSRNIELSQVHLYGAGPNSARRWSNRSCRPSWWRSTWTKW